MAQGHYRCTNPQRKDQAEDGHFGPSAAWLIVLAMPLESVSFVLVHLFCGSVMFTLLRASNYLPVVYYTVAQNRHFF